MDNHNNIFARLWKAFRSRTVKFAFSVSYEALLSDGVWRAALLNEMAPRNGARVLQVHVQESNISDDFLAKYPGCNLTSLNPFNPVSESRNGAQCLSYKNGKMICDGASFDDVICCMALHPLTAPAKLALLKEMRRVLRPRGIIYIADLDKALSKRETIALIGAHDLYGPAATASHSDGTWTAQIELAGFSHVKRLYNEVNSTGRVSIFRARR